jgi:mono/diheme cytochrome c family protein
MNTFTRTALLAAFLLSLSAPKLVHATAPWMQNVPAHEHNRSNPMSGNPHAIAAGQLLYTDHCSRCHGDNATGIGRRPSLRSDRIQIQATPGDLHWLLVNGSLRKGMPSWSKIPDPQLWQIISYIQSLRQ